SLNVGNNPWMAPARRRRVVWWITYWHRNNVAAEPIPLSHITSQSARSSFDVSFDRDTRFSYRGLPCPARDNSPLRCRSALMSLPSRPRFILTSRARIRLGIVAVAAAVAVGTIVFHILE